mmetsp:Transcript_54660/g.127789  ORF Transcript_54660/g.127789 Transcript_54660/m.127789 type:complete len:223 (-) Transcript_54660:135-803(-)
MNWSRAGSLEMGPIGLTQNATVKSPPLACTPRVKCLICSASKLQLSSIADASTSQSRTSMRVPVLPTSRLSSQPLIPPGTESGRPAATHSRHCATTCAGDQSALRQRVPLGIWRSMRRTRSHVKKTLRVECDRHSWRLPHPIGHCSFAGGYSQIVGFVCAFAKYHSQPCPHESRQSVSAIRSDVIGKHSSEASSPGVGALEIAMTSAPVSGLPLGCTYIRTS